MNEKKIHLENIKLLQIKYGMTAMKDIFIKNNP